jgi:hypothetical protein
MMVVALLSRVNDRAEPGLREGQLSRDANQWHRDKHPQSGLLLVVTFTYITPSYHRLRPREMRRPEVRPILRTVQTVLRRFLSSLHAASCASALRLLRQPARYRSYDH